MRSSQALTCSRNVAINHKRSIPRVLFLYSANEVLIELIADGIGMLVVEERSGVIHARVLHDRLTTRVYSYKTRDIEDFALNNQPEVVLFVMLGDLFLGVFLMRNRMTEMSVS